MRQLIFFICQKEKENAFDYLTLHFKNSLIEFVEDKFYFLSRSYYNYEEREQIEIKYSILEFNENLEKKICQILNSSYEKAKKISDEPISDLNETIFSEISTTINKYCYQECESIFYFVAELFYKYLMGHKLVNGNKRMALMFLIYLLRFFGYHMPWSYGNRKNYGFYEKKLIEWVEKFQKNKNNCKIEIHNNVQIITNWIKEKIVIAIEWRSEKEILW